MKKLTLVAACWMLFGMGTAAAQEHFTQGPVWQCEAYRTLPGKFDNYMTYLREYWADTNEAAKEAGLIVESKIFLNAPSDPSDWDVMFCTAYKNGSAALDYDAENDAKMEAITAKLRGTDDQKKQEEMVAPRFEMRTFLGSSMMREVTLKPKSKK